jgi:hypothetical protein
LRRSRLRGKTGGVAGSAMTFARKASSRNDTGETDACCACRRSAARLNFAPLHWGVADRREMLRDARQHTWRSRHGARDGMPSGETFGSCIPCPGWVGVQATIVSNDPSPPELACKPS